MDFTKKQISEISGLTPRLVQFYTEEGLILPKKNSGQGRGNVRRFSRRSLFDFLIVAELAKYGVTKARIFNCLKFLNIDSKAVDYFDNKFFEKGLSLFGLINTKQNNGKQMFNTLLIAGGGDKIKVLSIKDFQNCSSILVIDIGKLAKKAHVS